MEQTFKCGTCDHFNRGCIAPVPFWAEPHGRPRVYAEDTGCEVHSQLAEPPADLAQAPAQADYTARILAALEAPDADPTNMQKVHNAPDAGVVAELVEAAKALRDDMLERSRAGIDAIHGDEYRIVNAGRTAWADLCAVLAKMGVR